MNAVFQNAKRFVYQNARPLDFARWKYHFEGGSREDVLNALAMYQKEDGGFGYALEPDCWNPDSTPIATWTATKILREVNLTETDHPIIAGILRYLDSGKDFLDGKWCNTVPGNNDHPHAVWWHCNSDVGVPDDNPTVALCGFILCFAAPESPLWHKAAQITVKSVAAFMDTPTTEIHTLNNFLELLDYCERLPHFALFDLDAFRKQLYQSVYAAVCKEPDKWYTEYVSKPSFFFDKTGRLFDILPRALCAQEASMIAGHQLSDGSWPVTWQWWTDYKEYEVSANWWKSSFCMNNLLYLKYCGAYTEYR